MGLLKELLEWADDLGCQGELWARGDWHQPMRLLSRILAPQLAARTQSNGQELVDVTFKISFDSMLQLAEEVLEVPNIVTERDLMLTHPNLYVAVLAYLAALHSTLDNVDHKQIRNTTPPKLVFEARNGSDATFPKCPGCDLHVFFVERVLIDGSVWHRQCLRCARCGSLLRRGGWRRAKDGSLECFCHLPRSTLDVLLLRLNTSSVKLERPAITPPPPPPKPSKKPVPPPKPVNILKRLSESSSERPYESLESSEENNEEKNETNGVRDVERKDEEEGEQNAVKVEQATESTDEGKEKEETTSQTTSISSDNPKAEEDSNSNEIKSGKDEKEKEHEPSSPVVIFRKPPSTTVQEDETPIRPPRPKRASQLLQLSGRSADLRPMPAPRSPIPTPRITAPKNLTIDIVDYPDFLNPFGDEDDEDESALDETNPFAEDAAYEKPKFSPRPAPSPNPRSAITLPGTSDRPKSQPPPPPPKPSATSNSNNSPNNSMGTHSPSSKFKTLPRPTKTFRAPLPPVPQRRKIMFTEHDVNETSEGMIKKVERIEEEMLKVEVIGSSTEKELLINITQNKKVEEFLEAIQKKVELIRHQNSAMYLWLEAYLNEIHSEIEFQLRCLIEKEQLAKTNEELEAEAKLLELLVQVLTDKSELVQSQLDPENLHQTTSSEDASKTKKLFIRMKKLRKKLHSNKK